MKVTDKYYEMKLMGLQGMFYQDPGILKAQKGIIITTITINMVRSQSQCMYNVSVVKNFEIIIFSFAI